MSKRQKRKWQGLVKKHGTKLEYYERTDKRQRTEDRWIGWILIAIIIPMNWWVFPHIPHTVFNATLNPHLGLFDLLPAVAGVWLVWRSR